jgi:hypothetical protein
MQGWICLHRKLLEWEWYSDINTTRLFIHCLLRANHKAKKWQGTDVPAGSFIGGLHALSEQTGLSVQQLRTCIQRLKSTNDITVKATNKFSVITVMNWASYQDKEEQQQANQQASQQTNNNQITNEQQSINNKQQCKQLNNETKPKAAIAAAVDLPDGIDKDLFADYLVTRKKIKAGDSPRAMKLLISELVKIKGMGQDPNKAIEKAIVNNWKSVYPEKSGFGNQQPQQSSYKAFPL